MDRVLLNLARLNVGWKTFKKLLSTAGSVGDIPDFVNRANNVEGIRRATIDRLKSVDWNYPAEEELERLGIDYVTRFSPDYPERLKLLDKPPYVLFFKGKWSLMSRRIVTVVGSRKATPEGREIAFDVARDYAKKGWVVASGGAVGIDTASHRGALDEGCTIAVLGSSLDRPYPSCNFKLFKEIEEKGLLVSPFYPGTSARRYHFPLRNAVLASIAERVVVVEAGARSGSLITARWAFRFGVPVFAVDLPAEGNRLLLQLGARPISIKKRDAGGDPILELLDRPLDVDEIARRLNIDIAQLQVKLLELELKGLVRRLPGGFYKRA